VPIGTSISAKTVTNEQAAEAMNVSTDNVKRAKAIAANG